MPEFFSKIVEGKKEVTFYEVSKTSVEDFQQMILREFPGKSLKQLKMTLGIVSCTISEK